MGTPAFQLFLITSLACLCSCAGNRNLQGKLIEPEFNPNVCSSSLGNNQLHWTFHNDASVLDWKHAEGKRKLPKKFQMFAVNKQELQAYLTAANVSGVQSIIALPISEGIGCRRFEVSPSGTLSPELAKKYPQLISLKGVSAENEQADLRIDFDGEKMEAQINWNNQIFYISSWPAHSGELYYLVYKKEDSGRTKIPRKPTK